MPGSDGSLNTDNARDSRSHFLGGPTEVLRGSESRRSSQILAIADSSALETIHSTNASSLDLSTLSVLPTSDRIRRRSEFGRARPSSIRPDVSLEPESVELSVLAPHDQFSKSQFHASGVALGIEEVSQRIGDPEIGPSLSNSVAPSVRFDDETGSTAPVISAAQRAIYRHKGRLHFAALCFSFFLEGWNDGTTGPLLPTIQKYYDIGFAIVSLLFVLNCVGFLSGAILTVYLTDKFGFGKNAQGNGFVGSLKEDATTKLGFLHASYGRVTTLSTNIFIS
ncbi:hypothetical protein PHLCEN_2v10213 [Hermanssonia centrifuga]|uniref:Uncharacterized protein n=1 Tax=Hermanssonia centrifuga TaxID=98765 RepID=A0A2R6NNR1_9APHY|nr:hypothetical protein PHLCEN_2v10213 [Hermanssonia centrifuga]